MGQSSTIFAQPWEADIRLAQLGIDKASILGAVEQGWAKWAECTANHPVTYPGSAMHGETTCALRELLAPTGWRRLNESNQAQVINPEGNRVIIVSTGNEFTGRPEGTPKTRSKKGPRTISAVETNLSLFPEWEEDLDLISSIDKHETWILLIHRDMERQEVRSELSLPNLINKERRIGGWLERILLEAMPFGKDGISTRESGPKTPEIIVEIKKRG
jgi:hypothetical protein